MNTFLAGLVPEVERLKGRPECQGGRGGRQLPSRAIVGVTSKKLPMFLRNLIRKERAHSRPAARAEGARGDSGALRVRTNRNPFGLKRNKMFGKFHQV